MLDLYKNIKERRNLLGISQQELAEKVGYSGKSMIAKIEAGKVDLSLEKIQLFAEALQTTPSELMGNDGLTMRQSAYRKAIINRNIENAKNNEAMELFKKLSQDQQESIISLMKTMKK